MEYLLTGFIGAISGFVGALVGSGGLIAIPFLIFLGLPPQVAIATTRFGSAGLAVGSTIPFLKSNKIRWAYVAKFIPIAAVGALIGTQFLTNLSGDNIQIILGVVMLMLLPMVLFGGQLGTTSGTPSPSRNAAGYMAYVEYALYAGFIGAGAGTVVMFISLFFFRFDFLEVHATNKFPWMASIAVSLVVFGLNGLIWVSYGLPLLGGMFIGSYLGGRLAIYKGNRWLKNIFAIAVIIAAVRLLWPS